jgi:hypothetical protein
MVSRDIKSSLSNQKIPLRTMEVKGSFPCSKDPANYPYPEPEESNSHPPILLL